MIDLLAIFAVVFFRTFFSARGWLWIFVFGVISAIIETPLPMLLVPVAVYVWSGIEP